MEDAYKIQSLRNEQPCPIFLFNLATLAGARALGMEKTYGNFEKGKDADFQIINPANIPLLEHRVLDHKTGQVDTDPIHKQQF